MFQKEFKAGKQFVKDMSTDFHSGVQSDLLNMCNSQHKLKLTNTFDDVQQNKEIQINSIKQMMTFFNEQPKSEGCILKVTHE